MFKRLHETYNSIFNLVIVCIVWALTSVLFANDIKIMHELTKVLWGIIPALAGFILFSWLYIKWHLEDKKQEGER